MTFSELNLNDLVIVFTGVLLLFRKVAQMEHHHTLRVFLITGILSCVLIYFCSALAAGLIPPFDDCLQFANDSQSEF